MNNKKGIAIISLIIIGIVVAILITPSIIAKNKFKNMAGYYEMTSATLDGEPVDMSGHISFKANSSRFDMIIGFDYVFPRISAQEIPGDVSYKSTEEGLDLTLTIGGRDYAAIYNEENETIVIKYDEYVWTFERK